MKDRGRDAVTCAPNRPAIRFLVRNGFLLLLSLLACSTMTFAHAILVRAVPDAHSTVSAAAITIKLQFNVRVDSKRSRVALVMPDKSQKLLTLSQPSPDLLESQTTGLGNGDYSIRWQVLASDGHITQGEIPFKVAR